ncbi:unnamed protein product [Linum trigynum]|uniref:Uncharacterized protein n=1 Tax=Linum trigynum TaxID=586398 RepID=A0AAV2DSP0_9ROSI
MDSLNPPILRVLSRPPDPVPIPNPISGISRAPPPQPLPPSSPMKRSEKKIRRGEVKAARDGEEKGNVCRF